MYGSVYCVRLCLNGIVQTLIQRRNLHKFEIYENIYEYLRSMREAKVKGRY